MNRTELVTEILKLTGHKRSLHPDVNFGIQRLLDKYEKGIEAGRHETVIGSKYRLSQHGRCESHSCESAERGRCNRQGELVRIFQGTTNNTKLNDGHWEQYSCYEAISIDEKQGFKVVKVF